MNLAAIQHEPKSALSYMYDEETLHIRLRTAKDDIRKVTLLAVDPYNWIPGKEDPRVYEFAEDTIREFCMEKEAVTALPDIWFAKVDGFLWRRIRYAFVLEGTDEKILYHGGDFTDLKLFPEKAKDSLAFFNFPYMNCEDMFQAPDWVKDTVWYQIFPDRFCRGSAASDEKDVCPWGETERYGYGERYGGNLEGIAERLDYLQDLGVTGLYLTPVFESPSIHKYDISDYLRVDPDFGDNEGLGLLVEEAHRRGMRVMLDAVFNHCGSLHPFWQDVLEKGSDSRYYDCFYVLNHDSKVRTPKAGTELAPWDEERINYRTFAFEGGMPKWNTNNPIAREYLLNAAGYWIENCHIDGWRLDVSNEVSHDFWRAFRKRVRNGNPEIYILGENWDYSYPWLMGDQMDGVMNYRFRDLVWNFLGVTAEKKENMKASQFAQALDGLVTSYPRNVIQNLFNLLDSHDTSRIMEVCGHETKLVMLAYVLLLTMNGSPCIYYGDEAGLEGSGEANRKCMVWEEEKRNEKLVRHIKKMIGIRKRYDCCRNGTLEWMEKEDADNVLIYRRRFQKESLIICLHNEPSKADIPLPGELWGKGFYEAYREEYIQIERTWNAEGYGFLILWDPETEAEM